MPTMKKLMLAVVVAIVGLLPLAANATTGYVCRVNQYNYFAFGNDGGVLVSFYSGPNCTGSFQFTGYACTANSSTASCSSSSYYVYTAAQLLNLFDSLVEHGRGGNRVDYVTGSSCQNSGTNCLQSLNFYAD